jgi:hypothetical protein
MVYQPGKVAFNGRPRLWWRLMGVALLLLCTTVAGAAPANDEIAQATVITALPFTDSPLYTTAATTAADDPDCAGRGHTVWYVVTPAANLSMIVHTFGSKYDTTLSVYAGAPGALTPIACNNDYFNGNSSSLQSRVAFSAAAGTTYYIMVGSSGSGPGGRLLFWAVEPAPLGASVFGITPQKAVCKNGTTGRQVQVPLSPPASMWDCEAAGLEVSPGDRVTIQVLGTVEAGATDVGGAVTGMAPLSGSCTNVTTKDQEPFHDMVGPREVSCGAAGLDVEPGQTVQMSVKGVAE